MKNNFRNYYNENRLLFLQEIKNFKNFYDENK